MPLGNLSIGTCRFAALLGLLLWSLGALAERYAIPLWVPESTSGAPQGVLRILSTADESGTVEIHAIDDAGTRTGPATFTLNAFAAVEFTASDLASGNAMKGLSGGIGSLSGNVRLAIDTDLQIVPAAYVRAADGTLSTMHDTVRASAASGGSYEYEVPIFNPSTEMTHESRLRLINPGDEAATVTIEGRGDDGAAAPGGTVELGLAGGASRTLTVRQVEAGDTGLTGRLGAGVGKWRLIVSSDQRLQVVNVVSSTAGGMNNLSTTAIAGSAPADREAFNERFADAGIEYRTGRGNFTFTPGAGVRFTETGEDEGIPVSFTGSYAYEALGPDAGQMTVSYDDGDECEANLYFSTMTGGWFASFCTGSEDPDGYWVGGSWSVEDESDAGDGDDSGDAAEAVTYGADDALPGLPTSGFFFPAVLSGGSVSSTAAGTTIELNDNGYFELNDGTRYTCASAGGCAVTNGTVTRGAVTGIAAAGGEVDRFPTFDDATHSGNQTYTVGTAIGTLTLPEAGGGNGTLTYSLTPNVPGLSFDASSRRLTGTPSTAGTYAMTYTVRDEDGDTDSFGFTIAVSDGASTEGSLGVCQVGMTLSSGQSCTYPGTTEEFSVNARGRGSFLGRLAGIRIRIGNETINDQVYDFEASHQGDGVWRIDRIAGSIEPTTAGGDGGSGSDTVSSTVNIPDVNLRSALEATLGKTSDDPITAADMETLTVLTARNASISDLTGLETATNLTELNLGWNNISDASPLTKLSKLERLSLRSNATSDLSFLAGLTNLVFLNLENNNGITGIAPLAGLTNLSELWIGWNNISDPSPLTGLAGLEQLDLQSNNVSDLSFLTGLTNLSLLSLGFNDIMDISFVSGLTSLTELWINGNRVSDISPISHLTGLTTLILWQNDVADISPLAGLVNLTWLQLANNPVSDLSPLEGLTNLTKLSLFGIWINDLTTLASWLPDRTNIEELNLGATGISDVSLLSGLTGLTWLHLGNNDISNLSPLSDLTNLTELWLFGNNVSDLLPLAGLTSLTGLRLGRNDIGDVSPLAGLLRLSNLELEFNRVTDVSALVGLTALTRLDLRGNPLSESSINDRVPVLESRGAAVFFDTFQVGEYDIELVFSDKFSESQKNVLSYVARRWMAVIEDDLPDYEFAQSWSGTCGDQSHVIPAGERIDDLRIYIGTFEAGNNAVGYGGPDVLREDSHLPVVGCMAFNLTSANLLITGLHEIGHVLGFGPIWEALGLLQEPDGDSHFNGPLAVAAFDRAGGSAHDGAKVPLERGSRHWRASVFPDELMRPVGGSALSAITVMSLADLGYGVDVSDADPYTLPQAATAPSSADIASSTTLTGTAGSDPTDVRSTRPQAPSAPDMQVLAGGEHRCGQRRLLEQPSNYRDAGCGVGGY